MKQEMNGFICCDSEELREVNGGGVGGAIVGGIAGLAVGGIVYGVNACKTGNWDNKVLYKTCVAFTLSGIAIGGPTPL